MKNQLLLTLSTINVRYVLMALTILAVATTLLIGPGAPEISGDIGS